MELKPSNTVDGGSTYDTVISIKHRKFTILAFALTPRMKVAVLLTAKSRHDNHDQILTKCSIHLTLNNIRRLKNQDLEAIWRALHMLRPRRHASKSSQPCQKWGFQMCSCIEK